jgi:hypothetical protein
MSGQIESEAHRLVFMIVLNAALYRILPPLAKRAKAVL